MKHSRLFMLAHRYRYFFAGILVVSLAYGLFFLLKRVKPEGGSGLPPVRKLHFERFVMDNGLEVIVHQDATAPVVSLNMTYRVGSRDEPEGKAGLTHLTEHILLASAAARRGAEAETWAGRLGAWNYNGATDRDRTRQYMTVPKEALDAALWVESERMGYLSGKLTEEDVASARQDVLNELRRSRAETASDFEAALADAIFSPDHSYARLPGGAPADVEAISLRDVRQWLDKHYRPHNATLVVAGDVDPSAVRGRVEAHFGQIPGGRRTRQSVTWIPRHEPPLRYTTPALPAGTFALVWVLPGHGSSELDYLDLARHVIEARLTRRLVLEARAARSVQVDLKPYQFCSLLVLTVRANAGGEEGEVIARVERELADVRRAGAALSELDEAKRSIFTSLLFTSERVGGPVGVAEILASAAALAGDAGEFNTTVERVQAATADDILEALAAWLPARAATLITSGPQVTAPAERPSPRDVARQMPPVGEPGEQVRVVPERLKLANGLTVLVAKRPGPISVVKLAWRKSPGLSVRDELLIKAALSLGAEGDPSSDYARRPSRLILDDTTNYYALGLELASQDLRPGLAALAAKVSGARFDESRVAALNRQWESRVASDDSARWRTQMTVLLRFISQGALDEARRAECGPLTSLNAADLQRTFDTRFRPDEATLIVVGDTDLASLSGQLEELFGRWHARDAAPAPPAAASPAAEDGGSPIYILDRPGSDYAVVMAGAPLPPDTKLTAAASDLVTGLLESRASRILRDETATSHETFAGHLKRGAGGTVYISADAQSAHVLDVTRLVEETFRAADDPGVFCVGEFKRAQAASARRGLQARESAHYLANFLVASLGDAGPESPAGPDSCGQILGLCRQLSDRSRLVWVVLGDAAEITARLRPLGRKTEIIQRPCWAALY